MHILSKNAVAAIAVTALFAISAPQLFSQDLGDQSVAEYWNHATVLAISRDFARPTVHARNLHHTTIAMYDAWAAYDPEAEPYLLGRSIGTYTSPFSGVEIPGTPEDIKEAREVAISFAMYRVLRHRFLNSPGTFLTQVDLNQRMTFLGLDRFNTSTDYVNGGPAELGNYIAQQIINFGFTDGSNESADYANQVYEPVNPNILPEEPGTGGIIDPNRWQAISLSVSIDQSGNVVSDPPFLSPEWGGVVPFSLNDDNNSVLERDGNNWNVFFDPGTPPLLDTTDTSGIESIWKWNFCIVPIWQSHLDPDDETMIDISPATLGNSGAYPTTFEGHVDFYNLLDGGTTLDAGREQNPATGQPYDPQIVKRSDYGRVVAEFWADGPSSATPPGHWFEIYNEIRHHPMWENKWMGEGPELDQLEYDVKAYFTLGGAMHDAAITAWSIKGYYDYVRPVSAIRYMCEKGQCTDADAPNFHPAGMPLMPGYIEQVEAGDPLAGTADENVGKIKLYTWKGPDFIADPENDAAGVGWILGENWWPYQRPSFVTPPFAGFVSGHSTYSRTAAEVLTLMTGSEYFPGGMSNFVAPQNEFLEFEQGPSETITLQWATYRDASDQCSLSRIWGGIHPPADDIPGRLIGIDLGPQVFDVANELFNTDRPVVVSVATSQSIINIDDIGGEFTATITYDRPMNTSVAPLVTFLTQDPLAQNAVSVEDVTWLSDEVYQITYTVEESEVELENIFMRIRSGIDTENKFQNVYLKARPFIIDTKKPEMLLVQVNATLLNSTSVDGEGLIVTLNFNEPCDTDLTPDITLISGEDLSGTLAFDPESSGWTNDTQYEAHYILTDNNEEIDDIGVSVEGVTDIAGNALVPTDESDLFAIDTRNPDVVEIIPNTTILNTASTGSNALTISVVFDKAMDPGTVPSLQFSNGTAINDALILNTFQSGWANEFTYNATYNQTTAEVEVFDITAELISFQDLSGNPPSEVIFGDMFSIDTRRPQVMNVSPGGATISDSEAAAGNWEVELTYDEPMDQDQLLLVQLQGPAGISPSLIYNPFLSDWLNEDTYIAVFNVTDQNIELEEISMTVSFGKDHAGNDQTPHGEPDYIAIDTKNPEISVLLANVYTVSDAQIGPGGFSVLALFDEMMTTSAAPEFVFTADADPLQVLTPNAELSNWQNGFTYHAFYDVADGVTLSIPQIEVALENVFDLAGNAAVTASFPDFFALELGSLSASNVTGFEGVQLYPNPLHQGQPIHLAVSRSQRDVTFSLWDMSGKSVSRTLIPHLYEGVHRITPPALSSGVYFGQLQNSEGSATFKIVVTE